jgi:hypothetical protein
MAKEDQGCCVGIAQKMMRAVPSFRKKSGEEEQNALISLKAETLSANPAALPPN